MSNDVSYFITTTTGKNPSGRGCYVTIIGESGEKTDNHPMQICSRHALGKKAATIFTEDVGKTASIILEIPHDANGGWSFTDVVVERFIDGVAAETVHYGNFGELTISTNPSPLTQTLGVDEIATS